MNNLVNNSTLWFQILMILLLLLTMPVSPESLAQTNDANSNKVDFVNIAYLIGLSGLISAVVSAMINYFNNYRRSKSERQRKAVAESRLVFDVYFLS